MKHKAKHWWSRIPSKVRKPIVLIIGCIFIIAAGLTGWLPGPGGIPLFLIGIAILATEFEWAERLRDRILDNIRYLGHLWKQHKIIGTLIALVGICIAVSIAFYTYNKLN